MFAAVAIVALSASDLLGFIGSPPAAALHAVRSHLRRRNLLGLLDLLYGVDPSSSSSSTSSSASSLFDDHDNERSCMASPCSRRSKHDLLSGACATGRWVAEEAEEVLEVTCAAQMDGWMKLTKNVKEW